MEKETNQVLSKLKSNWWGLDAGEVDNPYGLEAVRVQFESAYQQLDTAVCLCSGLEIAAANPACKKLLNIQGRERPRYLVNQLFQNPLDAEALFLQETGPVRVRLKETGKLVCVTANRWIANEKYWIVQWRDLSQQVELEARLNFSADFDAATGALNGPAFARQMTLQLQALKAINEQAILVDVALNFSERSEETRIDLLTNIIDQLSHEFGEKTLISRQNSDELRLLCETGDDEAESRHIVRQIMRICVSPGTSPNLTAALFPEHGETSESLLRSLEIALVTGDNREKIVVYDKPMLDAALKRQRLASDMVVAIAQNQITPHFQPVIDAQSEVIKGFEALVRWIHPEFGYVIPPEIISIAAENNHLDLLTAHIMRETITQMKNWPESVQFSVNVTPNQLTGDLVDMVRRTVRQNNIDPGRLEIEVTEDALISDFETSAKIFARLRAIGVSIAMDDFGAGYTSIGNLRKLDFTKIKIDKIISDGLPDDPRSIAIVRSLMFMAAELGVDITVEGIETEEQRDFLRTFNCAIQGYVFSPPLAPDKIDEMRKYLQPAVPKRHDKVVVSMATRKSSRTTKVSSLP